MLSTLRVCVFLCVLWMIRCCQWCRKRGNARNKPHHLKDVWHGHLNKVHVQTKFSVRENMLLKQTFRAILRGVVHISNFLFVVSNTFFLVPSVSHNTLLGKWRKELKLQRLILHKRNSNEIRKK